LKTTESFENLLNTIVTTGCRSMFKAYCPLGTDVLAIQISHQHKFSFFDLHSGIWKWSKNVVLD